MNHQLTFRLTSALLTLALASMAMTQTPKLNIGDKAPEFKVDKWYKGAPVPALVPGKIYVVEFWATWCVPCKEAMPHITELAKKYKDEVIIAGVSVAENGSGIPAKIQAFVADMGDKMDYHVAGDVDGYMWKNWMEAAGENSIPCSFIIDGTGKVAFIGHPQNLEGALKQMIAGTYNLQAAKEQRRDAKSGAAASAADEKAITDAIRAKDFEAAITAIRKGLSGGSQTLPMLLADLLPKVAALNESRAYEEFKLLQASPEFKDKVNIGMAFLVDEDGLSKRIYQLGLDEVTRMSKRDDAAKNTFVIHMMATGNFRIGELDKAIELEEKALAMLKDDPQSSARDKRTYETALAKYKAEKAKAAEGK